MITHNEESRVHADTNAVQGETRDRALVTTVRGRHLFDTRHYGYQVEQFLSERERNCDESDENVSTIKTSQSGEYFCLFVWLDHVHNKTSCFSLQKKNTQNPGFVFSSSSSRENKDQGLKWQT